MLRCRPLLAHADHFFTASSLQLTTDAREWDAVASHAGVKPDRLRLLHQVHGRDIVVVRGSDRSDWSKPTADGAASDDGSVGLVVRIADCAPLLMADPRTGAAAAVHAGWRSTMQRIAEAAVQTMVESFGTDPEALVVAIGPSLGECCGEMGEEVVEAFRSAGHAAEAVNRWFSRAAGRKPHFDLWRANHDQLVAAGVRPENVHVAGLCTRTHPDAFHSYRAAGQSAGRMAAVIRPAGS